MTHSESVSDEDRAPSKDDPATTVTARPDDSLEALLRGVAAAPPVAVDSPGATPAQNSPRIELEPQTLVAQAYRVERRLGAGGMGVVYLAHDLKLDRPVALKLQLGGVTEDHIARIRREARAMARLAHPNVLTVHDVGTHDERVYIAMEYVDGGTFKQWLSASTRPWAEIVDLLVEAGQGLAAAHAVGIVHRDFKPDNILIGVDGRPRVADFGLARSPDDEPTHRVTTRERGGSDLARLTTTGAVVGTPAYMSPEQFDGLDAEPASDQFAFCVVMYEALFGQRPFPGTTTASLADAVHTGQLRAPPQGHRVPAAIIRELHRGLRPLPSDRYPSLELLLARLRRIRGRTRQRTLAIAGVGVGVFALATGYGLAQVPDPCAGTENELDTAWSPDRRAAVESALHGDPAVHTVIDELDAYATQWITRRRTLCESAIANDPAAKLELAVQTACLNRLRGRFEGLTRGLTQAAAAPQDVADELPGLDECDDPDSLLTLRNRFANLSWRETAEQDRAMEEIAGLLSEADTRRTTGAEGAQSLYEQARALANAHQLKWLEAQAHGRLADLALAGGHHEQAAALYSAGTKLAAEAGDNAAAAELALGQAVVALQSNQLDEATTHLAYFEGFIARVESPQEREVLRMRGAATSGLLALARGNHAEVVAKLEPLVDKPDIDPLVLEALAHAYRKQGRAGQALAIWEQRAKVLEQEAGDASPLLAQTLNNIGLTHLQAGTPREGLAPLRRALAIAEQAFGPEHGQVAQLVWTLGRAHRLAGNLDRAADLHARCLEVHNVVFGQDHPNTSFCLEEQAELALQRRDYPRALRNFERVGQMRAAVHGAPAAAKSHADTGRVLVLAGEPRRAIVSLRKAWAQQGDDAAGVDPLDRATTAFWLARALAADPSKSLETRDEISQLLDRALADAAFVGDRGADLRARLERYRSEAKVDAANP